MVSDVVKEGAQAPEKSGSSELAASLWSQKPEFAGAYSLRSEEAATRDAVKLTNLTLTENAADKVHASIGTAPDSLAKTETKIPIEGKALTDNTPAEVKTLLPTTEANSFLLKAADETVHKSIYKLPSWAHLSKPDPGVGCVSSFSNRYREALRLAGDIPNVNDKQYRNYFQVNMDEMNRVLGNDKLLSGISSKDAKEGDVIEGVNPGTTKRHVGIVGRIENGQRQVYDNYGGIWHKESLEARFGQYQQQNYYRAFLPPKS